MRKTVQSLKACPRLAEVKVQSSKHEDVKSYTMYRITEGRCHV